MTINSVETHLQAFLATYGEEAWRAEIQRLVLEALRTKSEKHEVFWRELTKDMAWLDWDLLKQQADAVAPDRLIVEALKSQMPGIRTQAQYDAAVGALEGARLVINAILAMDWKAEQDATKALEVGFGAVRKATELTFKLEGCPEAAVSQEAQQFKTEPAQFQEVEILATLFHELSTISDTWDLKDWYARTKHKRDRIKTQSLRNELLDAIRARHIQLVSS